MAYHLHIPNTHRDPMLDDKIQKWIDTNVKKMASTLDCDSQVNVFFTNKDEAMLCKLVFGGTFSEDENDEDDEMYFRDDYR
jgi:hypothetical protein